jgi:hypothetical protein
VEGVAEAVQRFIDDLDPETRDRMQNEIADLEKNLKVLTFF